MAPRTQAAEQKNYNISRSVIKLVLILAGLVLSNHLVFARLNYFIDFKLYFAVSVFLGIWLLALLATFYTAFTGNRGAHTLWAILICFSTLLGETYFRLNGQQISVGELDSTLERAALAAAKEIENPGAVGLSLADLISQEWLTAILATGLLAAGLLLRAAPIRVLGYRPLGLFPLLPFGLLIALVFYLGDTHGNEDRGMPSQFHSLALITAYALAEKPSVEKADVEIALPRPADVRHIVVIVDESVSGDFIDLNVPRQTTPFLNSDASGAINFGLAVSAGNCSNSSNAVLRLGANPSTLGLPGHSIINNPSIWKYARTAGYETTYINAQPADTRKRNYMNQVEWALIDNKHQLTMDTRRPYRDFQALKPLIEALSRDKPQFIYVNKNGVYNPFFYDYPDTEAVFEPALKEGDAIAEREKLVNSYKNGIRWAVDGFFKAFMEQNRAKNFVIIYTSDHGQNLLDDGKLTTHCRRNKPNLFEATVPLLVWTDVEHISRKFEQAVEVNKDRASHFQVFPTILSIMGYEMDDVRGRYYKTLFDALDLPPGFTSGSILGRFGGKPEWNSSDGLEHLRR